MEYYTIDSDKLAQITLVVQETLPDVQEYQIREYCLADWPEGDEHQNWLDGASAEVIADWVITGVAHE